MRSRQQESFEKEFRVRWACFLAHRFNSSRKSPLKASSFMTIITSSRSIARWNGWFGYISGMNFSGEARRSLSLQAFVLRCANMFGYRHAECSLSSPPGTETLAGEGTLSQKLNSLREVAFALLPYRHLVTTLRVEWTKSIRSEIPTQSLRMSKS